MQTLIVTTREPRWSGFAGGLEKAGHRVAFVSGKDEAVAFCRETRPSLLVWDKQNDLSTLRDDAIAVMMVDVRIHQCVATSCDKDTSHEAAEGLGFLPALPAEPTDKDALITLKAHDAVINH